MMLSVTTIQPLFALRKVEIVRYILKQRVELIEIMIK